MKALKDNQASYLRPNPALPVGVIGGLLVVSWLMLAVLSPNHFGGPVEYIVIGLLLGTMFGQTTLAATWTALGPFHLVWRLPLSLAWLATMGAAFGFNVVFSGPPDTGFAVVLTLALFGQWVFVQLPLWGLRLWYGVELGHWADPPRESPATRQFGIRQLMVLTAIVAVLLGIGRLVVMEVAANKELFGNVTDILIIAFLAVASVITTLPLVLGLLIPRWSILATAFAIGFLSAFTWVEMDLLRVLTAFAPGGGPHFGHILSINVFQAGWIILVLGIERIFGYALRIPTPLGDANRTLTVPFRSFQQMDGKSP